MVMVLKTDPTTWHLVDVGSRVRRGNGSDDAVRVASETWCGDQKTVRYHDPQNDPVVTSWSIRTGRSGEWLLWVEQTVTVPHQHPVWHNNFHIDYATEREGRILFASLLANACLCVLSCKTADFRPWHGLPQLTASTLESVLKSLRRPSRSLPDSYHISVELLQRAEQTQQIDPSLSKGAALKSVLADVQRETRRARMQFERSKRQLHALRHKERLLQSLVNSE